MDQNPTALQNKWLYSFIGVAVLINFSGLFNPIIGPDGTLYAVIAKNMVQTNNYADLFNHGRDWLDKPHFPFWITALSFKCFGFTTWAYKLPAILFLSMGTFYTYLFAKNLYNKPVALWSVLVLLTAEHIVLSNNDVRAEPYLTGLIIASVYHFYRADKTNSFWQLLAGCIFGACAIMTKGMFAVIPIAGSIAGHLIITKQWKRLFSSRWLLAIVLVLILILPEMWCLYRQFDLHPEKVVFGEKGVSGIKFFFWDSQFGRFFNSGPIKGHGDPSFFVHTLLWAFLPWSLLLFAAIFNFIKKGSKNAQAVEWYCICGALLTFLVFSASKFQLPHYLNIVFPFFAILTAQYLYSIKSAKTVRAIGITQAVIIVLLLMLVIALQYFFRPEAFGWLTSVILLIPVCLLIFFPAITGNNTFQRIAYRTLLASFIVNLYLNLAFYPSLMKYQAASEAANWINHNNPQHLAVREFDDAYVSAFEFYNNSAVTVFDANASLPARPFLLYAPVGVVNNLKTKGYTVQTLKTFKRYWVSRLKPSFLNEATRAKQLDTTAVVKIN
ncbi:MAG TPA: glycosyltransferase family 39 protein [Mucilaginibacter sp.]|jgi:4-amino-4-deoxy-L-arabinose transferase-like glycosyltransferase|nr:glycosyltransferase family 39 protein [Mucilaginibacter sp.]